MTEEKKKETNLLHFAVKVALWLLLYASFWYFDAVYKQFVWLGNLARAVSFFLTFSILFSLGRYMIITIYNKRHEKRAVRGNFVLGINRLTVVLNTTTGVIGLMIAFGIDPVNFATSLTIFAMAIAVTFREYITNLISGLFVMFSDQLSVGDRIEVAGHKGRIVDINFSSLVIQNEDNDMVTVPNNTVFTSPIVNLSAHRSSVFLIKFELPLQTDTEVAVLEKEIQMLLTDHPNLTPENDLQLKVVEIGKDFVRYKMEVRAKSSSTRTHQQIENDIFKQVLKFKQSPQD